MLNPLAALAEGPQDSRPRGARLVRRCIRVQTSAKRCKW